MKKILFGILLVSFWIVAGCSITENSTKEDYVTLSDLSSTVQFYSLDDKGVKINYFAVLGSDGKPRTAFDACDICGGQKGYEQQGNDIACRNCGKVFSINGLGTKNRGSGCWPSYLPHKIIDGNVLIKVRDIKLGRSNFI